MTHRPHLYYFQAVEFRTWWLLMDHRLLVLLDSLRHQHGKPIRVSPDSGALGRQMGQSLSQHNIDRWGEVRAVDVIPEGLSDATDLRLFADLAADVGFTGIGVYPHWASGFGVHLDVRVDAKPGNPTRWGAINNAVGQQRYVTFTEALEAIA